MGLHRKWSLKGWKSPAPPLQSRRVRFQRVGPPRRFIPSVPHPETTGCPRNRPWACVCCVCGVSCERCSGRVRGKVFVSPSPGPSVCCVSAGCAWCCGSSTGRRPDPGPARRGPHLETQGGVRRGTHIRWQDRHSWLISDWRLYILWDIICPKQYFETLLQHLQLQYDCYTNNWHYISLEAKIIFIKSSWGCPLYNISLCANYGIFYWLLSGYTEANKIQVFVLFKSTVHRHCQLSHTHTHKHVS